MPLVRAPSEDVRDALVSLSSCENGFVISQVQGFFANARSVFDWWLVEIHRSLLSADVALSYCVGNGMRMTTDSVVSAVTVLVCRLSPLLVPASLQCGRPLRGLRLGGVCVCGCVGGGLLAAVGGGGFLFYQGHDDGDDRKWSFYVWLGAWGAGAQRVALRGEGVL